MKKETNLMMSAIFCYMVLDSMYRRTVEGNIVYALFSYLFVGFALWSCISLHFHKFVSPRIIIAWMPAVWSDRVDKWSRT